MKLKTHQTTAKKVKVTKTKKLMMRHAGQDHFNAREDGNTGRHKRKNLTAAKADIRNLRRAIPYA
jgi:ribosomal protein L35